MSKKETKRLVLLDTHAILHRAYHALPDFTSNKGEPTGALYGLSLMLLKIIEELRPDYIIACYDLPKPTYRHEAYADYKAGRKEADDDLIDQIKRSREVFEKFNIPIYDKEGFEADDILGTIVEKVKNEKELETIIASGDMDTLQLVDKEKVKVYTLRKGIKDTILYDETAVKERFGFPPKLLPDYKGLRGDPSDNIPGIKGIGEKAGTAVIVAFGSLEDIYKNLDKDEEKFKEKAGLSPRMVKLIKEGEEEAKFSKELALIRRDAPIKFSIPKQKWEDSLDISSLVELFRRLSFKSLIDRVEKLFGYKQAPIETLEETPLEDLSREEEKSLKVAVWLIDSENTNPDEEDILEFSKKKDLKTAKENIFKELEKKGLDKVFKEIEKPLIPIVEKIEERGIRIDTTYLKNLSKEYHEELEKLEKKIWKEAGVEFNVNSPKQLSEVIFDKLEISSSKIKKTPSGARSTRESELLKMKDTHPIIEEILKYRELQKLLSTYIDNIPQMVDKDGRLRASFNQTGATTGRMSSQNPNLQNIPIKTELGRKIRNAFVATEDFKLYAFDYSQIELRIAAFLSGDKKLIKTFKEGKDVHTAVASEVFEVSPKEVTSEMRRQAKIINFGILYGMGVNALRANLGTDRATAQKFYNDYLEKFSGLFDYLEKTKRETAKNGYTKTIFGRRRNFPGIKSRLPYVRAQAERMAINAPIQGSQADIIKKAMVEIDNFIEKEKLQNKAHLLLQVHDELIYEIQDSKDNTLPNKIEKIMENIIDTKKTSGIKLEVGASSGYNWGEMEELKK